MDLDEQLQQCQSMTLSEFVAILAPNEPDWDKIEQVLGTILKHAAEFYDDFDDYACAFALRCAADLIKAPGYDDAAAKKAIFNMAGVAWGCIRNAEEMGLSGDTRVRLEQIRETDPEFVEG